MTFGRFGYLSGGLVVCLISVVVLFAWVRLLSGELRNFQSRNDQAVAAYQDSLKNIRNELTTVKESTPGLGEFMTTMQLHMGKLWFAAQASNSELAAYELDELKEAMEGAKSLHEVKNGVNVSNVLDSVLETQIAQLAESIQAKKRNAFQRAYDETLSACNGCHEESGRKFINITRPTTSPVTNQRWEIPPTR
jgi:cytochrome c553